MAENSTEQKFWNCPSCGGDGVLTDVRSIFEDTRFDVFECKKCGCGWRHYYKIAASKCELVRAPKVETPADAPATEETTDVEVTAEE